MAGMTVPGYQPPNSTYGPLGQQPQKKPTSLFGNPATFTAAANTQAGDYDRIMQSYADLLNKNSTSPYVAPKVNPTQVNSAATVAAPPNITPQLMNAPSNITPQTASYTQSGDVTGSLANLSDLATTGGYSDTDIANIRARGISPIRSIYANAQRNIERQRSLQGGYSPNFSALQAKMARDEASQIGDVTTNVNAGIAQNVASNKLAATPAYASASAAANAAKTAADQRNADIINQINQYNSQQGLQVGQFNTGVINATNEGNAGRMMTTNMTNADIINQINEANAARAMSANGANAGYDLQTQQLNKNASLAPIQGMASLYGTTPALTSLFGNQVGQAAGIAQNQQQINQQKQRDAMSIFG